MELVPILRALRQHRLLVSSGVLVAVLVAVALGAATPYKSTSAVAWTRVTLDTPDSQLLNTNPDGAGTLPWRARLLMHGLATEPALRFVARRLGVPRDQVAVVDEVFGVPRVPASMPLRDDEAAAVIAAPLVATVRMPSTSLPLISIEAAAPDAAAARRLAAAVVAYFREQSSPGGRYQSQVETNAGKLVRQPYVISRAASVRVEPVEETLPPLKALAASVVVFLGWCLAGAGLGRRVRRRSSRRVVLRAEGAAPPSR